MAEEVPRVFGLGQCCIDYLCAVDAYPGEDAKCETEGFVSQCGGPAATALVALARWGLDCSFTGIVGDDDLGTSILASLKAEGVDASRVLVRPACHSQLAFIVAVPDNETRTIFWCRPSGAPPSPSELDGDAIRQADILYTDGLMIEASLAAARVAREAGTRVIVDAGTLRDGMLELAELSDGFIVAERFARALVGRDDPARACRELARLCRGTVGVTLGERGYLAMDGGQFIEGDAYPADVVDTTGCGDLFHAGFAYGVARGWLAADSLAFGAWAAARVSEQLGGRAGIPAADDFPGRMDT